MRKGSTVLGSLGVISAEIVVLILPFVAAGMGTLIAPTRTCAAESGSSTGESGTEATETTAPLTGMPSDGKPVAGLPQEDAAQREALAARKAWLESQAPGPIALTASLKAKPKAQQHPAPIKVIHTRATWYGPGFHGHRTASGERFDRNAMTLASRHLPMGTRVRVINLMTGKSAVARVNDRGPFRGGYQADLSQGLARKIGMGSSGPIRMEVLSPKDKSK